MRLLRGRIDEEEANFGLISRNHWRLENFFRDHILFIEDAQIKGELESVFKSRKDFYKKGDVFEYFATAFDRLWYAFSSTKFSRPGIQPLLSENSSKGYEIAFTGYSLGGALANLAAFKTYIEILRPHELVKLPFMNSVDQSKNLW